VACLTAGQPWVPGVGHCVLLPRTQGGRRGLVLPKMQYDKTKTRFPNMQFATPALQRRHGLGIMTVEESSLARGLPPITSDCVAGVSYVRSGGLRRVEPYYDTMRNIVTEKIKPVGVGMTLVDYLSSRFTGTPRRVFPLMCRTGQLVVNLGRVGEDYLLQEGDVITHTVHRHEIPVLDLPLEVIYTSDEMVVVNKPSSWPVHPVSNYRMNTLTHIMYKELGYHDLRMIHRIDAATSGILMMGRGRAAASRLAARFRAGPVRKEYVALVDGRFPEQEVECREPVTRYKLTRDLWKTCPPMEAATTFRLLEYCGESDTSLVSCVPVTGRTHQIRLHLLHLGHPVVQDSLYNQRDHRPGSQAWEQVEHPIVVAALDRMEEQLEEQERGGGGGGEGGGGGGEVSYASLSRLAQHSYCLHCQTDGLLEARAGEVMCLHSRRYTLGEGEGAMAFEAALPPWASQPSSARPPISP